MPTLTEPGDDLRSRIRDSMTEAEFQERVIDLATLSGWTFHAERPGRTTKGWRTPIMGDPGFPDLVMARMMIRGNEMGGRLVVAEIKSSRGKETPEQLVWLANFRRIPGVEVFVWRPRDWKTIVDTLARPC